MERHLATNTTGTPGSVVDFINNLRLEVDTEGLVIDGDEFGCGSLVIDAGDALALIAFLNRPAVRRVLQRGWIEQQKAAHEGRVADFVKRQQTQQQAAA